MNRRDFERKSAASTLSDMEIFVFPELLYALVLANLMSPRLWRWQDDPWFGDMSGQKPARRIARLKQFVMDHYAFNLDLDTWGLTTKERERARFRGLIDDAALRASNALFGYEGDRYYFDLDIRTHFGLDKYTSDTIPYWKTETVEAMDAFRFKPGYTTGAGECVSLSTLYAAGLFLVAGIPLRDIFLMATPLHSQNFIDVDNGMLTNNRRLVTKNMWFNGTALSAQARRALDHEQVTVVAHESGWIHTLYTDATIAPDAYARFDARLRAFLTSKLTVEILGNFLRHQQSLQKCFQLRWILHGADHYLPLEKAFAYENGCAFRVTDKTRAKLLGEVEVEEFLDSRLPGRIVLNDLEAFVETRHPDLRKSADTNALRELFVCGCMNAEDAITHLILFCKTDPHLPDPSTRHFAADGAPLELAADMSRETLIARLEALRGSNSMVDLAFYVYRDLNRTDPAPFVAAALERSPVSRAGTANLSASECEARVRALEGVSIYDEPGRLAQPDEVWNFGRGDGVEKALLLANLLLARDPAAADGRLDIEQGRAVLYFGGQTYGFETIKGLRPQSWILPTHRI